MPEEHRPNRLAAWAERTLDHPTFETVIVPALADLEHECAAADGSGWRRRVVYWRAYWGLMKAVALCCLVGGLKDVRRTAPAVTTRMLCVMPMVVAILIAPVASWIFGFGMEYGLASGLTLLLLQLPVPVLLAIPVSFFVSVALHRELTNRLASTAIAGSIVCSALVFVLVMEVVPALNTISRVYFVETVRSTHPSVNLRRGLSEMSVRDLNEQIANPPSVRQGRAARTNRQERFAFVALVPILGFLGLTLAGRWQSRALTVLAAVGVFTLYGASLGAPRELVARGSPAPVWTANAVLLGLAILILMVRSKRDAAT